MIFDPFEERPEERFLKICFGPTSHLNLPVGQMLLVSLIALKHQISLSPENFMTYLSRVLHFIFIRCSHHSKNKIDEIKSAKQHNA